MTNKQNIVNGHSKVPSLFHKLQVTGALRNLADVTGARELFVSTGVVRNLAIVLGPYSSDGDVVWNVCRALR